MTQQSAQQIETELMLVNNTSFPFFFCCFCKSQLAFFKKISEKIEQSIPPSLDNSTIKLSISAVYPLFQSLSTRREAGRCLNLLSAVAFDDIEAEITKVFNGFLTTTKGGKQVGEEELTAALELVSYLHCNSQKLIQLLTKLENLSKALKKLPQQTTFAEAVYAAIWNWINKFTIEFIQISKLDKKLSGKKNRISSFLFF